MRKTKNKIDLKKKTRKLYAFQCDNYLYLYECMYLSLKMNRSRSGNRLSAGDVDRHSIANKENLRRKEQMTK